MLPHCFKSPTPSPSLALGARMSLRGSALKSQKSNEVVKGEVGGDARLGAGPRDPSRTAKCAGWI